MLTSKASSAFAKKTHSFPEADTKNLKFRCNAGTLPAFGEAYASGFLLP
jgi:hypothetical protein